MKQKNGEFELEELYEIWGNDSVIEVGPDRDGLALVEIRVKEQRAGKWEIVSRILLLPEQASLLILALSRLTQ